LAPFSALTPVARSVAAQNYTMDVLGTNGRPLAFFRATGAFQKSGIGMFVLTGFFDAKTNFAALSPIIRARTAAVSLLMWMLYWP